MGKIDGVEGHVEEWCQSRKIINGEEQFGLDGFVDGLVR